MLNPDQTQKLLNSLISSQKKDKDDLERQKKQMAELFKQFKKEDLFKPKEKLTLWQRIRKVMNF
jgi:hypothetical protein